MTDKNKVKVTIEHDGSIRTVEHNAAFVVAFTDCGEGYESDIALVGRSSFTGIAEAIADSIIDLGGHHDDLLEAILLLLLFKTSDHDECEE